jgi:hypothetical protein
MCLDDPLYEALARLLAEGKIPPYSGGDRVSVRVEAFAEHVGNDAFVPGATSFKCGDDRVAALDGAGRRGPVTIR